jgi:hypothetical protein
MPQRCNIQRWCQMRRGFFRSLWAHLSDNSPSRYKTYQKQDYKYEEQNPGDARGGSSYAEKPHSASYERHEKKHESPIKHILTSLFLIMSVMDLLHRSGKNVSRPAF